jgi:hypothetical protein
MRRRAGEATGKRLTALTLWAQQLGWLHAKPGKAEKSRIEELQAAKITPPMPDVGPGQYLVAAFHALRFATPDPMGGGMAAQSWGEVLAFAQASGRISETWEAEALFDMSWGYVTEFQKASDPLRIAPMERSRNG